MSHSLSFSLLLYLCISYFSIFLYLFFLLTVYFLHFCHLSSLLPPFVFYPFIRPRLCAAIDTVAVQWCVYQVGMSPADRFCYQRNGPTASTAKGNQLNIPFRADPHERYMAYLDCAYSIIRFYMCVSSKQAGEH
jgi:hypothetical protein